MKEVFRWHSPHVEQEIQLVRWGTYGTPVLLFPTAGGDAEEPERFHMIEAIGAFIEEEVRKVLAIPDGVKPIALTPLGYPAREAKPRLSHRPVGREGMAAALVSGLAS